MTYLYKREHLFLQLLFIIWGWYTAEDGFCSQLHHCKFALTVRSESESLNEKYSIIVPTSTLVKKVVNVSIVNFGDFLGVCLGMNLVYKVLAVEHFKQAIYCSWFTQLLNKCTGFFVLKHIPKSVFIIRSLIWFN